jgi:hypothetical protein
MQTDWGGEYEKLNAFFQKSGITHHVSCPHAHQQNGSAERKHRHIVEVGLALLANASMPLKYWDEAFLTATFLINLLPSKVINLESPTERLLKITPNYDALRTFGCACWPNLHPYNARKLAFRSKRCVFLGYSPLHKGIKCLDVSTGRVYISRDVVFDENVFPFQELHPNAGALLKKEILLLPTSTPNEVASHADDHMSTIVPICVPPVFVSQVDAPAAQNLVQNDATQPPEYYAEISMQGAQSGTNNDADSRKHSSDGSDPEVDSNGSPRGSTSCSASAPCSPARPKAAAPPAARTPPPASTPPRPRGAGVPPVSSDADALSDSDNAISPGSGVVHNDVPSDVASPAVSSAGSSAMESDAPAAPPSSPPGPRTRLQ